jgi:ElaB/YqjD/DUF883 family membrane-anchored ribosome-binding protein
MSNARNLPDIGADLATLKDDFGELVKQLVARNRDKITGVKDDVFDKAGHMVGLAEDQIKARPMIAMLIAFVIGIVCGMFARRS